MIRGSNFEAIECMEKFLLCSYFFNSIATFEVMSCMELVNNFRYNLESKRWRGTTLAEGFVALLFALSSVNITLNLSRCFQIINQNNKYVCVIKRLSLINGLFMVNGILLIELMYTRV